jgi:hypothetical protein
MGLCTAIAHALRTWIAELFLSVSVTAAAFVSQAPGMGLGTARASTERARTIIIYGGVALILPAGLAAALKRRLSRR